MEYTLGKVIVDGDFVVRVNRPVLDPKVREQRMARIKKSAEKLLKSERKKI